jgi:predicted MPP superfamily phosphohydrolase
MSRFLRFILTVTAVIQLPFVVFVAETLRRFGTSTAQAWTIGSVLGILGFACFFGPAKTLMHDEPRPAWRVFLVDMPYWWHWCTCLFCLVPSVVYLVLEPLVDLARGVPVGPAPGFFMWTYVLGLLVCGWGISLRRWWFTVERVDVPIRGLDRRFDGYTIAHLSDLHIGNLTPLWWGQRWARVTNAENVDAVVVTGDMVTSGTHYHEQIAQLVGELRGKDGVFVAMGNHDYFGEGEPLISLLRARGAVVLRNEGLLLERDAGRLHLSAIDDTWTKRADMDRALENRPEGVPSVLLAHDPDRFPEAVKRGVDLVLSGHTHGGQIAVPFFARAINASKLAHQYHLGVYTEGDSTLYVHPGLGTTGPPMRLGVAPKVVVLKLRTA